MGAVALELHVAEKRERNRHRGRTTVSVTALSNNLSKISCQVRYVPYDYLCYSYSSALEKACHPHWGDILVNA